MGHQKCQVLWPLPALKILPLKRGSYLWDQDRGVWFLSTTQVPPIVNCLCPHSTPVPQKEYMDQLWFEKAEGMFCVDLRATLPGHKLTCPSSLQLPTCAVGDMAEACFCLNNVG